MSLETEALRGGGAPVVLVTGCSSGLGRALALALHSNAKVPYRVVATARRLATLSELADAGIQCGAMDVTNDDSVRSAVEQVLRDNGRIDGIINNAGLSRVGPVAEQSLSEVREVLETNVLGVLRATQAVVPAMIEQRRGLVVMVGSVTSTMTTPWSGAYSASKAALMSLADALRLELRPFGIGVTYVMAGAIKTSIADNINSSSNIASYEGCGSAYRPWVESIRARANASQTNSAVMSAEAVAAQIVAVVDSTLAGRSPPTYFFAGGSAWFLWLLGLVQKTTGWPVNAILAKKYMG